MATRTMQVDDLDGTDAVGTFIFGLEGDFYAIDLSEANAKKLRDALTRFIKAGRPIAARDALKRAENGGDFDAGIVRAWLVSKGRPVNDKGRIPAELVAEWVAAGRPQNW